MSLQTLHSPLRLSVGRRGAEGLGDGLGGRALGEAARAGARLGLEHLLAEQQLLGRRLLGRRP